MDDPVVGRVLEQEPHAIERGGDTKPADLIVGGDRAKAAPALQLITLSGIDQGDAPEPVCLPRPAKREPLPEVRLVVFEDAEPCRRSDTGFDLDPAAVEVVADVHFQAS